MEQESRHPGKRGPKGPENAALAAAIDSFGRERRIKTVQGLSDVSGIPYGTVVRLMNNTTLIDYEHIRKFAKGFGVRAAEIVARADSILGNSSDDPMERHMQGPPDPW